MTAALRARPEDAAKCSGIFTTVRSDPSGSANVLAGFARKDGTSSCQVLKSDLSQCSATETAARGTEMKLHSKDYLIAL